MEYASHYAIVQMPAKIIVGCLKTTNKSFARQCKPFTCEKLTRILILSEACQTNCATIESVYSNVCGPTEIVSNGRAAYFVVFIDEASCWVTKNLISVKSNVQKCFQNYLRYANQKKGKKLKLLLAEKVKVDVDKDKEIVK